MMGTAWLLSLGWDARQELPGCRWRARHLPWWWDLPADPPPSLRVADWFAQLNNKMGGDLKKIQTVGNYMVEIWKAVGMDMERVEFLHASGQRREGIVCMCVCVCLRKTDPGIELRIASFCALRFRAQRLRVRDTQGQDCILWCASGATLEPSPASSGPPESP